MKKADIRQYFLAKLGMTMEEGSRHEHYFPVINGSTLCLPVLLSLSRGRGDLHRNNTKGIAVVLGLSVRELNSSVACTISGRVCYFSAAAAVISRIYQHLSRKDPVVHRWEHDLVSVAIQLSELSQTFEKRPLSKSETTIVTKHEAQLQEIANRTDGQLSSAAMRIASLSAG
jgi:hypothetical protein